MEEPISATITLLHLIAGVCLLLWGVRMVRLGFIRGFGTSLRRVSSIGTRNRFTGFLSGMGVTALLQSSTATALILSSFAGRGLLTATAGLAVMLGADVGTTLVAQFLSIDMKWLGPFFLSSGVILHMARENSGQTRHIARILIGLGFVFLALAMIAQASEPLKHSDTVKLMLRPLEAEPLLAILFAAFITWLAHSSLATVLFFASIAGAGIVSLPLGLVLVVGANIGGTIAPIVATYHDSSDALRIPFGNMVMRLIASVAVLPFVAMLIPYLQQISMAPQYVLVNFHMAFNIGLACVFMPFIGPLSRISYYFMPKAQNEEDETKPRYLDDHILDTPSLALAAAARETLRISDIVEDMLKKSMQVLSKDDHILLDEIQEEDDVVDSLFGSIKMYIARLMRNDLDPKESDRCMQVLSFATNLEHAADTIDKSLMQIARKKIRNQDNFSEEGLREIEEYHGIVVENMRLAQNIFLTEDSKMARELIEGKQTLRHAERMTSKSHLERLQTGLPETIATSSLHMDIIRDLRRINTYISSVAYPILEEAGELKASPLRKKPKRKTIGE